jgi:Arc/MetJ family transcription regulator
MRTNIVIDEDLMDAAMRAGSFKTKKDAVEAGLKLLARQAAYRDLLALRGQLHWEDAPQEAGLLLAQPRTSYADARTAKTAKRARAKS